ncbi:DUF1376 domain-containing protein [Falsiroseomonas sp.]|uniref:YdaU family protein n=1 Tax=Falsiroseomonas sp. TaxID=2870721 RepID=UPI00273589A6|nr:DUF1376 domain-containing protein [Falsiroseomonas sp.]MDP3417868.1 DUF1376 domain-containing protein [Falsiroseomonas sp.]
MSRTDTWMPLYIGDYLADTMHLTGPEHGAYLLLLMHSWRTGPLPDDDRQLAAIARTEMAAWRRMRNTIRAFFKAAEGRLVQDRMERIRAEQEAKIEQASAAGKASAEKRKAQREAQRNGNARSTPVAVPLGREGQPNDNLLETEIDKSSGASLPAAPPPPPPDRGPVDRRSELWAIGLPRLVRMTGKPTDASRAILGRLLRDAGDDCELLNRKLLEAEDRRVVDPVAWLEAAIGSATGQRASKPRPGHGSGFGQVVRAMRAAQGAGPIFDGQAEDAPAA